MQCKNVRIKLCLLEAKLCFIILDFKLTLPSKASVYNDPECSEEPEARAELFRNEGQQKPRSRVCTHLISDTQFLGASFDTSIPDTLKRGCVNLAPVHASS